MLLAPWPGFKSPVLLAERRVLPGLSWCCLQALSSGRAVSIHIPLVVNFSCPFFSIWYSCFLSFVLLLGNFTAEDSFLSAIINYTNSSTVHFKLSPTYVLYMACRYVLSSQYRPEVSPPERTHKVIAIVNKMVSMMEGVIQVSPRGQL